ncbi:MAG: phenylalanine--tRNA ligase subunit alpha [Acidimicrobiia bacterium]|nr:phenylalanine--tRNA ligase subunit alpha [Acidimicrobiia bacterium]
MTPLELLDRALSEAPGLISAAESLSELDAVEARVLGPDSDTGQARKAMRTTDPADRPALGARLQEVTAVVTGLITEKRRNLDLEAEKVKLASEQIDVTLESLTFPRGSLHLIQQTIDDITDIFVGLGYQVADGPEADLAWFNFDALNTPPTHPSRLESDTMYLDFGDPADEVLLRAHTSTVQIRWMLEHEPPVHIIAPGKAYRTDTIDATHLPVFHQIEGLVVDENITFSDLKGTLAHFAREFFGPQTEARLRPHFFPFTEPSAELDVSCFNCQGTDPSCRVCRGAGWLEMLGCGMVHPKVLEAAGYDSTKLSGFAFGMGVERPAMVRHGINDIRMFIDNDVRFLRQF